MKRIIALILVLSLSLCFLGGCDNKESDGVRKDKIKIAVVLPALDSQYWAVNCGEGAEAGAKAAAKDFGVEVEVLVQGPTSETQTDQFVNILETVIASEKPDGIILASMVPDPVGPIVADAAAQGIYVNLYGYQITTDESNWHTITHTDHSKVGLVAADGMYDAIIRKGLPEDGVVAIFGGTVTSVLTEMHDGFAARLKELLPNITVLDCLYSNNDLTTGVSQIETVIGTYGDKLVGIWGDNNISGTAVARAVEEANIQDKVATVGVDADSEEIVSLLSGSIDALVVMKSFSQLYNLMYITVDAIVNGTENPREIALEPTLYTAEMLKDPSTMEEFTRRDLWPLDDYEDYMQYYKER